MIGSPTRAFAPSGTVIRTWMRGSTAFSTARATVAPATTQPLPLG